MEDKIERQKRKKNFIAARKRELGIREELNEQRSCNILSKGKYILEKHLEMQKGWKTHRLSSPTKGIVTNNITD